MASERLFLDIRYYESDCENIAGSSLPSNTGRIFSLPKSINPLGARIARKLREYGFTAGVFDHLYVNFTTVLGEGQCRYSPREVEECIKYVDFGLSPEKSNSLADAEKEALICQATFIILKFVAGGCPARLAVVDRVSAEIQDKGSELEIVHKQKETEAFAVTVTYQIRPNGEQSVGLIEYHDKKSRVKRKGEFVKFIHYEDVFALVGSITLSRGVIKLKPRPSFKASLYSQRYRVPIEIPISDLDVA